MTLTAILGWGAALIMTTSSMASASSGTHHLCWRGSSDYEFELVFCDDEQSSSDDEDIAEWYCFKSVVCQDWKSGNRRCPMLKGCATEDTCTADSGDLLSGEQETVGALTIQTWCSLAENSEDHDMLSLRTPTNGARSNSFPSAASINGTSLLTLLTVAAFVSLR